MNSNPAIIWGTRRISWEHLKEYGLAVIGHLKGLGIKPGDRVAICAAPCPEYVIIIFSLWRMGAVACPVSTRLPAQATHDYLSRVRAVLLLTTLQIKSTLPGLAVRTLFLNEVVGFDARRDFAREHHSWEPAAMDQEVSVIATSGSSGEPKPAVHTWGNHYHNAQGAQQVIPITAEDRWLLALPLYHVSGLAILVRCFLAGAAVVIPAEDDLAETIQKRQVTHASLVATQMHRLMGTEAGQAALKSLKYILLGGSAIPPALMERSRALGLNVFISYGLTETASQVATGKAGEGVNVLPHRELMVDASGEILVKGPVLFKGYIKAGHLQLPLTPEGWFRTGDLGRLDANGCLTVLGRKDNMFISGGENVQPEEIERVLLSLSGIQEAVVVPREDAEFGQRPVAFIKFSNQPLPPEAMVQHCAASLPRFKIPQKFYPWPQNLLDQGLKVSRQELRQLGATHRIPN